MSKYAYIIAGAVGLPAAVAGFFWGLHHLDRATDGLAFPILIIGLVAIAAIFLGGVAGHAMWERRQRSKPHG